MKICADFASANLEPAGVGNAKINFLNGSAVIGTDKPVKVHGVMSRDYIMIISTKKSLDQRFVIYNEKCDESNIDKIHDKFVSLGKASIKFKQPARIVYISKANHNELIIFLRLVKRVALGNAVSSTDQQPSTSANTPNTYKQLRFKEAMPSRLKDIKPDQKTMFIRHRSQMPSCYIFPKSLKNLSIDSIHLSLRSFASMFTNVLKLSNLVNLKVVGIDLTGINSPLDLRKLHNLMSVTINMCGIKKFPWLPPSLIVLDLQMNLIDRVPSIIVFTLPKLQTFNISYNCIMTLPTLLGTMPNLLHVSCLFNLIRQRACSSTGYFNLQRGQALSFIHQLALDDPTSFRAVEKLDTLKVKSLTDLCKPMVLTLLAKHQSVFLHNCRPRQDESACIPPALLLDAIENSIDVTYCNKCRRYTNLISLQHVGYPTNSFNKFGDTQFINKEIASRYLMLDEERKWYSDIFFLNWKRPERALPPDRYNHFVAEHSDDLDIGQFRVGQLPNRLYDCCKTIV